MGAGKPNLVYLNEAQNAAFDAEYHKPDELARKIALLKRRWPTDLNILDLGGGNGGFLDTLLGAIPYARATNLDISKHLLGTNKPHPRKSLVHGSIEDLETVAAGERFDLITINWVLHHMVGPTHRACGRNVVAVLESAKRLLKPGGAILVAETVAQGPFGTDLPGWLVYEITRIKQPLWVKIFSKVANTAGVGVCFHAQRAWERLFRKSGLRCEEAFTGFVWNYNLKRRITRAGVAMMSQASRHTLLVPA